MSRIDPDLIHQRRQAGLCVRCGEAAMAAVDTWISRMARREALETGMYPNGDPLPKGCTLKWLSTDNYCATCWEKVKAEREERNTLRILEPQQWEYSEPPVLLRLEPATLDDVDTVAKVMGCDRADVLRRYVREGLARNADLLLDGPDNRP